MHLRTKALVELPLKVNLKFGLGWRTANQAFGTLTAFRFTP